jgi:hypothetical protein
MKALHPTCKGWFSDAAGEVVFDGATSRLVRGSALSNEAFLSLANTFDALSLTDVRTARSFNTPATQEITLAGPAIQMSLARLTDLER